MWLYETFILLFITVRLVFAHHQVFTFDVGGFNASNNETSVYQTYKHLSSDGSQISIKNIPETAGFYIVQVHSFMHNITLSSSPNWESQTYISGTNIGLVDHRKPESTFYLYNKINWTQALIVVTLYNETAPIPGGCNLSFDPPIAPYQRVFYSDELITVLSQAPSALGTVCEANNIQVEMYHLYLPENNFDPSDYFDGLSKMVSVKAIRENGKRVNTPGGYFKYKNLYSLYMGVGQIFAIIATYNGESSAYVPAVTYGCDLRDSNTDCNAPVSVSWKIQCALMLIFGLFTCFFGYRSFRLTLYLVGFTVGMFCTYSLLTVYKKDWDVEGKTVASIIIAIVYAIIWFIIWCMCGKPIFLVAQIFALSGFLITSTIFYFTGLADYTPFRNEVNFWLTQLGILLIFCILFSLFTLPNHMLCTSLLGAYACIIAISYYTRGNLQYIVINLYRRITVKDFRYAIVDPPYLRVDLALTVLWGVMTGFGVYYQWKQLRGRPPFPPPNCLNRTDTNPSAPNEEEPPLLDETTPLIREPPPCYTP